MEVQTKIESLIKSIKSDFDEIFKSMFNIKKIDIKNIINVMNIQLMYDMKKAGSFWKIYY